MTVITSVEEGNSSTVLVLGMSFPSTLGSWEIKDGWEYSRCLSMTATGDQCRRKYKRNLGTCQQATDIFNTLKDQQSQTPDCCNRFESFVALTHCKQHHRIVLAKWRTLWEENKNGMAQEEQSTGTEGTSPNAGARQFQAYSKPGDGSEGPIAPEGSGAGPSSSPEVEDVTGQITHQATDNTRPTASPAHPLKGDDQLDFVRLGLVNLRRMGSLKQHSNLGNALTDPLNDKSEQLHGIVYILKLRGEDNVFKIGFTAEERVEFRVAASPRCMKGVVDVIYPELTVSGTTQEHRRFFGAKRAEIIAQRILANKNLNIQECPKCHVGHREWFYTTEADARDTVIVAERFVQWFFSRGEDGKWALNDIGRKVRNHFFLPVTPTALNKVMEGVVADGHGTNATVSATTETATTTTTTAATIHVGKPPGGADPNVMATVQVVSPTYAEQADTAIQTDDILPPISQGGDDGNSSTQSHLRSIDKEVPLSVDEEPDCVGGSKSRKSLPFRTRISRSAVTVVKTGAAAALEGFSRRATRASSRLRESLGNEKNDVLPDDKQPSQNSDGDAATPGPTEWGDESSHDPPSSEPCYEDYGIEDVIFGIVNALLPKDMKEKISKDIAEGKRDPDHEQSEGLDGFSKVIRRQREKGIEKMQGKFAKFVRGTTPDVEG
ncbi:hypothetical protein P885DRAFT_80724 [Corynascus similis CBS 632.67]